MPITGTFVVRAGRWDATLALRCAHVARFAADECLVSFDFAGQFLEGTGMQREPDAVIEEPGSLLGDADCAVDFVAADAICSSRFATWPSATCPDRWGNPP